MSEPLVFIELAGGQPTVGSLGLLAVGRKAFGIAAAYVGGPGAADAAHGLGQWGASTGWWAEDPGLGAEIGAPHVDAIEQLLRETGPRPVLFENSPLAAEVAAGLAARLGAGVNWDLIAIEERDGVATGHRLALDDSIAVDVGWTSETALAVFRVGTAEPVDIGAACETREIDVAVREASTAARVVERQPARASGRAPIATADVVVAGGRGLRDRASLGLLEDLAEALGGAVGVSLPIVDRGWYPQAHQVGQTGTRVRPRLYLACGISGSLAHRVGMEKSSLIVAINTDATAPIFGFCDLGVVGDLHTILPELTRLVREGRAGGPT